MIRIEEIPVEQIREFWDIHFRYLVDDGIVTTEEDRDYFQSAEYRDVIKAHRMRTPDTLHMVYFLRDGVRIGASQYCTYKSEDGKCFILDYWVFPEYRGQGTGHECFQALYRHTQNDGAKYYALNYAKEDSRRFWQSLGFVEDGVDEYGSPLMIRREQGRGAEDMKDLIQQKLNEIEAREGVRILHCVESGSRAWGFASPDSDYDVRFIYARPLEAYLRLEKTRDVIEWQLDDTLDINGWDLQKALRLLHKSNPTLFEWNGSPIVYRTTEAWKCLSEVIDGYFLEKSGLYHYLSTAKKNYREYLRGETVRLKKYFYVLRPILACRWILAEQTPPPMLFSTLMDKYLDEDLKPDVQKLLRLKMETPEIGEGKRMGRINDYLDRSIEELGQRIVAMPAERPKPWEELDKLFLTMVSGDAT